MKNLFLSALLVLTVSFAFANNEVEKVSTFDVEQTVELTNSVELVETELVLENSLTKLESNAENVTNAAIPCCITECEYLGGGWWSCVTVCGECIIIIIM